MPPADFQQQMQSLKDWGYTSITISLLVQAITRGVELPARPVVITFDDGYASVYENAYPVMKELGFSGVLYLIANAVGADGYMNAEQVKDMIVDGWEVGSHSMTHPHLPEVTGPLAYELVDSRDRLKSLLGTDISTFAYPFGDFDLEIIDKVVRNGYTAGVGLGSSYVHNTGSLFYLSRIEIVAGTDITTFAAMLPWSGQP
jgi:peptidoglycan/xylan/chitin deacetylase (PgdA/CDA1 family)